MIVYLTVGYPEKGATAGLLDAALSGGADLLELGVPFSDPLADGATVQRASEVALAGGVTVADCLWEANGVAGRHDSATVLFGYANPFLRYGLERLATEAAAAGVSGFIVPDLPVEESAEFASAFDAHGLARIDLFAPTTPDARLDLLLPGAQGFAYCVSLTGVTGARRALATDVAAFVGRVRARTNLPLAVGFGISEPEHVAALRGVADGIVVGSAAIDAVTRAQPGNREEALRDFVRSLVDAGRES